jgi:tagaturonate reductase
MEQLNRSLTRDKYRQSALPEKVMMFGGGAFLRAFACPAFDELNKRGLFGGSVTVIGDNADVFKEQDGLFTVVARENRSGEKTEETSMITCVENYITPEQDYNEYVAHAKNPELRFVVYEKIEAEINAFLHERFVYYKGDVSRGLIFLPCAEGYNSGAELKNHILKCNLSTEFNSWVSNACFFANTLADRFVSASPSEEIEAARFRKKFGYRDKLLVTCELFYFWAIEAPVVIREELPLDKSGLNIVYSESIAPYKLRKERLLDGALAAFAPSALLCSFKTAENAIAEGNLKKYLERILFAEIIPTLDFNRNILESYAKTIIERLSNPFVKRELLETTHDCAAKFKTHVLPTILEYRKRFGELPPVLIFSFAAMLAFHKNGGRFPLIGDERSIAFLRDNKLDIIFKNISGAWGINLSDLLENTQFKTIAEEQFNFIKKHGVKLMIERLLKS